MSKLFNFTSEEKKIRKQWLIATFVNYIGFPLLLLLICTLRGTVTPELFGETFASFIGCWLIYHCAYEKHGWLLLTWWLVLGPLYFLADIKQLLSEGYNQGILFLIITYAALYVWWYINSIKLRKINIQLEPRLKSIRKYLKDINSLRMITNLESLSSSYQFLLKKWPEFEKTSLKEYEKIKSNLLLNTPNLKSRNAKEAVNPDIIKKAFYLLKAMVNDKNNIKRGLYRIGIVFGIILALFVFVVGFIMICVSYSDFSTLILSIFFILFPLILLTFSISLLVTKSMGWIFEGFQRKSKE
ncbi:hypothetical protein KJ671_01065 [Patescibacteria group bacterium]|nr:hypothetical protein [Patescibacteria group bacterium]